VLVVSTSEGMLHRVLCHTTNLGPAVALDSILVVGTSSLQEGLVGTSSTGDNTDLSTDSGRDSLLSTRWKTETGGTLFIIMGDDHGEAARSTGESTAIANLGLNVAHNGTLGNLLQRQHISNVQSGLLSAVDELSSVHTLSGDHELGIALETVGVQELDLGDGRTSSWVMKNFLDDSADVATTLSIVDGTKLDGSLARARVGLEDRGLTLSLCLLYWSNRMMCDVDTCCETTDSFHESIGGYALSIDHKRFKNGVASWFGCRQREEVEQTNDKAPRHIGIKESFWLLL